MISSIEFKSSVLCDFRGQKKGFTLLSTHHNKVAARLPLICETFGAEDEMCSFNIDEGCNNYCNTNIERLLSLSWFYFTQ